MRTVTGARLTGILILSLVLLAGCPAPSGPKRTDQEREAMRVVQVLRAALAEVELFLDGTDTKVRTPAELCYWLGRLRDITGSQYCAELATGLPEAWFDETVAGPDPGLYGGYRFILVREGAFGVYALPEPSRPEARTVFYARLPAGLFERSADGFSVGATRGAPEIETDSAWRPVSVMK